MTVRDEGYSQSSVEVPIKLRVMNFKLERDPKKRLSAYYEPRNEILFKDGDKAFVDRATANEYQSMIEHGLDTSVLAKTTSHQIRKITSNEPMALV